MEPSWKRDLRDFAVIWSIIAIFSATMLLSYYVTNNMLIFILDVPISVAYQVTYPDLVSALLVAACVLILKRPGKQAVLFGGMVLGVVSAVFVHDVFTVFVHLFVDEEPTSVLAMLVTASVVPSAIGLLELRKETAPQR